MQHILDHITSIAKRSDLLFALTQKEIKQRYKQSLLGYAWVILTPLLTMLVLNVVFAQIIRIKTPNVPYPLFVYVGLLIWNFFSNALLSSTNALVANANLITKTYFPRDILIYATILAKLFDLLLASSIFILFMIYFRQGVSFQILWLPLLLLLLLAFAVGISFIFSVVNVFYRDAFNFLNLLLLVWMYITPVFYPITLVPQKWQPLYMLNPMTAIIENVRKVVLYGNSPDIFVMVTCLTSLTIFVIGMYVFKKQEYLFADVV